MRTTIRKAFFDYEKEEQWLNYMASKGFALIHYSWCKYVFEDSDPGEYIYRIELLSHHPTHPESIAYIRFMEEMGVEHVSSYIRWIYFRKKASDGPFDIYSDIDSKIKHYGRVLKMTGPLMLSNLLLGINNLYIGLWSINNVAPMNLLVSMLNMTIAVILFALCSRYYRRIRKLKKDKTLRV